MKTARQQAEKDLGISKKPEYKDYSGKYQLKFKAKTIAEFAKEKECTVQNIHQTFADGRNKGWEIVKMYGRLIVITKDN